MQQIEKKQILCQQIDIKLNVLDATKSNKINFLDATNWRILFLKMQSSIGSLWDSLLSYCVERFSNYFFYIDQSHLSSDNLHRYFQLFQPLETPNMFSFFFPMTELYPGRRSALT